MITRRRVLTGGIASIALHPDYVRAQHSLGGCGITADQAGTLLSSEQIWRSYNSVETGSGDRDFDRALAETLQL